MSLATIDRSAPTTEADLVRIRKRTGRETRQRDGKRRGMPGDTPTPMPEERSRERRCATKSLSSSEERALAAQIRHGDRQAIDMMVLANLGLVVRIVRTYQGCGLAFEDLKQEGIRGLIRACTDFDPGAHDVRFSTYASYWIRHTIQRAVMTSGSMIRLPDYIHHLRSKYHRTLGEVHAERLQNPDNKGLVTQQETDVEIATRMGIPLDTLGLVRQSEIERTHFHREAGEGDSMSFEETIPDTSQPLLDLDSIEEMDCLREGLDLLSPIEAWIIRRRFGIEEESSESLPKRAVRKADRTRRDRGQADSKPMTITWIARSYGLSPNTVRRCEESAIAKLREHMRKRVGSVN